jgi:uncharacterized protein (DUF488 family)
MEIYTIGFTKKTAEEFFTILKGNRIRRLLDVRLNNVSQLSGFTKKDDLDFFLRTICDAKYMHQPLLAPTQELLDEYKKNKGSWEEYERQFTELIRTRAVHKQIKQSSFEVATVLLCSEPTAEHCHRRLVAEYLQSQWGSVSIVHL